MTFDISHLKNHSKHVRWVKRKERWWKKNRINSLWNFCSDIFIWLTSVKKYDSCQFEWFKRPGYCRKQTPTWRKNSEINLKYHSVFSGADLYLLMFFWTQINTWLKHQHEMYDYIPVKSCIILDLLHENTRPENQIWFTEYIIFT